MSLLKIATNFNIELEFSLPPFHKRMFAWMIDFTLSIIYLFAAIKLFSIVREGSSTFQKLSDMDMWGIFLLILVPMSFYPLLTELFMNGQTVGKRIMSIKVINETGGNATISQFLIRWMLRVSELIVLFLFIAILSQSSAMISALVFFLLLLVVDILCVALTKKAQRLGDMAAGTLIINTKSKNTLNETVFVEVEDTYIPKYPEVMQLKDKDLSTIKTIYNNALKRNDFNLAYQTAEKVKSHLKISSSQEPIDFLETVLKDYNFLSAK
ncbi:RDD family protein [Chitinophagaceae bacterium LWZ2-11]